MSENNSNENEKVEQNTEKGIAGVVGLELRVEQNLEKRIAGVVGLEPHLESHQITFGKYKGRSLNTMLRDRKYCNWVVNEDWFIKNYEYLRNRVSEYDPRSFFLANKTTPIQSGIAGVAGVDPHFLNIYPYFNLKSVDELEINLTENEVICYTYYLTLIDELKQKIIQRIESEKENLYDIKAPVKWLQKFEKETGLMRDDFKDFINSFDLPNLTYIIEDIKKEGGIKYEGAQSFIIAKKKSLEQEAFWENILKSKYGEDVGIQFKFQKCFFDFINIRERTIYECKIGLKDYNDAQYKKYLITLDKYNIIYLIGNDAVINIAKKTIYTTNLSYYLIYQCNILKMKSPGKLDEMILDYAIIEVSNIKNAL